MSTNRFEGPIPTSFCGLHKLSSLDLSDNSFSGTLPSCFFNLSSLRYVQLQGNVLTGHITTTSSMSRNTSIVTLDIRDNTFSGSIPSWIGGLSSLRILLMAGNNFQGTIPIQLCWLHRLGVMDLSHNYISGSIPPCFKNITFGRLRIDAGTGDGHRRRSTSSWFAPGAVHGWLEVRPLSTYSGRRMRRGWDQDAYVENLVREEEQELEFISKYRADSYKGSTILNLMSGLDLSWNQLTGEIPPEIGELSGLKVLNLSHNRLEGSIPEAFVGLEQVESMDLSYNRLSGGIPSQLTQLYRLSVFNVAHNNLSGRIPDGKAQFGTFDKSAYEGNPNLCGALLERNCTSSTPEFPPAPGRGEEGENGDNTEDSTLYVVFTVSFVMWFLIFVGVLYFSPYCRGLWFYHVDTCIQRCRRFLP